ncbi:MAG: glycosyltransferase [Bacteroidota bacterium]
MTKQITIVMAYLNEGDEPRQTIKSIYQTAPSELFEIIAVDDCSDEAIDDLSDFPEVSYIRNEKRMGTQASKHLAVSLAKTPFILLIDAHMRFRNDHWCQKMIEALKQEPETVFCTTCIDVKEDRSAPDEKGPKRYGADLLLIDPKQKANHKAIIEAKWIKKKKWFKKRYEIPCLLGANYGFSRAFFMKIRGLEGLKMWGTTEPFLSLKIWLAGGKCKVITDVHIAHLFRNEAPYKTAHFYLTYNKLFVCKTIFPEMLGNHLINHLNKDKAFFAAMMLIERNESFIAETRDYYQSIFSLSIQEYCKKFRIAIPT